VLSELQPTSQTVGFHTLKTEAEQRARKGLGWIIAHVDELRPAVAMSRWTNADRARMAAAECAVACQPLARLAPLEDRVFVALLADWIERLAVPELIAWSRTGAPSWYRPLVLTAGALAESGVRIVDLELAVRTYGPPTAVRGAFGRAEHRIDTAYWWGKLRQAESCAVDVACEEEIRRLLREPANEWTAQGVHYAILCQSDYGKAPMQASRHARQLLQRSTRVALTQGHVDLAAQSAFAWWCLGLGWSDSLRPLLSCVSLGQRSSGAFVPSLRQPPVGSDETERCHQATLMGVLGCLAIAELLRQHLGHDGSSEEEKTANAAQ
jgi:hypothetical protein